MINFYIIISILSRALLPLSPGIYASDILLPIIGFIVLYRKPTFKREQIIFALFIVLYFFLAVFNLTINPSWEPASTFTWDEGVRLSGAFKMAGTLARLLEMLIIVLAIKGIKINKHFLRNLQYVIFATILLLLVAHWYRIQGSQDEIQAASIAVAWEQARLNMPSHSNPNVTGCYILYLAGLSGLIAVSFGERTLVIPISLLAVFTILLTGGKSLALAVVIWFIALLIHLRAARYLFLLIAVVLLLAGGHIYRVATENSLAIQRIIYGANIGNLEYRLIYQWLPAIKHSPNLVIGAGYNYFYSMDSAFVKVLLEFGLFSLVIFWIFIKIYLKSSSYVRTLLVIFSISGTTNESVLYSFLGLFIIILILYMDRKTTFPPDGKARHGIGRPANSVMLRQLNDSIST